MNWTGKEGERQKGGERDSKGRMEMARTGRGGDGRVGKGIQKKGKG